MSHCCQIVNKEEHTMNNHDDLSVALGKISNELLKVTGNHLGSSESLSLDSMLDVLSTVKNTEAMLMELLSEKSPFKVGDYVVAKSSETPTDDIEGYVSNIRIADPYRYGKYEFYYELRAPGRNGKFSKKGRLVTMSISRSLLRKTWYSL